MGAALLVACTRIKKAIDAIGIKRRDTLESVQKIGRIVAGCVKYPPFCDYELDGNNQVLQTSGLYADLLNEIGRIGRYRIEWKRILWHELHDAVESGRVDVIVSVFGTLGRRKRSRFCRPLHLIPIGGVILDSNARLVRSPEDLKRPNLSIGLVHGEIAWEYAKSYLRLNARKPQKRFHIEEHENIGEVLDLVTRGTVDIALADAWTCEQFIQQSLSSDTPCINPFRTKPLHTGQNTFMVGVGQEEFKGWIEDHVAYLLKDHHFVDAEESLLQHCRGIVTKSALY